jgi:Domain of unknown function (DUF2382)
VVTEQVTKTVPVEEVRLERESITDANRRQALDGPEISDEEHEVILHEEELGVEKAPGDVRPIQRDTEPRAGRQRPRTPMEG